MILRPTQQEIRACARRTPGMRGSRRSPGGMPAFLPTAIPDLQLWLRADMGITLNGSNVSGWADQSGTGDANKNVVQGTAARQPAFNSANATYANMPTVDFTGASNHYLLSAAWASSLAQPFTDVVIGHCTSGGSNRLALDNRAAGQCSVQDNGGSFQSYCGATVDSAASWESKAVAVASVSGGNSTLYLNARTAKITAAGGAAGRTGTIVGNYGTVPGAGNAWNGPIAEIMIYSRALSPAEVALLLAYAGARYNITIGA